MFQNKTVLVTGASGGIGEDFVRQLAEQGANLVLVARSEDKLQALAKELYKIHQTTVYVCPADLSQASAPQEIYEWTSQKDIHVDVLVNNAGFGRKGPFEEGNRDFDQGMIAVNIQSLVALTHLFIKPMLQKGEGGVINIASTASFQPIPFLSLYAATKAFVLSFTEALWGEYKNQGLRFLCLCPGNTTTNFHQLAGIEKSRVFLAAKSEDVVRLGLSVYQNSNRPTVIFGFLNTLLAMSSRFMPRRCVIWVTGLIYRSWSSKK